MVSSELNHNPYLLSTIVKFNGQEPKINSQIEKYEHIPLKDWVHKIPSIFYNEMNGYDFDFYFTGTRSDFNEIKRAFEIQGISDNDVRLIYKNELEDADVKKKEVKELFGWLKETPNRKFDFNEFLEKNEELFEWRYPYIIIGNVNVNLNSVDEDISVEVVSNTGELENTILMSIPILFYIEEARTEQFREDLSIILNRKDVRIEQLFFMIDTKMDNQQVARVISDLGVDQPQVIDVYNDKSILMYIQNYPVTEFIRTAINEFSNVVKNIDLTIKEENKKSKIKNEETYEKIDSLEKQIDKLKKVDETFVQRDNYEIPREFNQKREEFSNQILKWKNRKTKVIGNYEAEMAADHFESYMQKSINLICEEIKMIYEKEGNKISEYFSSIYSQAGTNKEFMSDKVLPIENNSISVPKLKGILLDLKETSYEEEKTDFFGLFKKQAEESEDLVEVVTYYFEQWRDQVMKLFMPVIDCFIEQKVENLQDYYDSLAKTYHLHLEELIRLKSIEKNNATSQLSDEERKLQEDNDWLDKFKDYLNLIERG